ncbi:MAG TPA: hypothetical protein VL460_11580 [Caulobacteraceae bacterium]|jgi:hypothetical protein|nr:hypothetical protein [Caulobacteraceae bacterium]
MEAVPKKAVWAVAFVLFGLALLGAYQGWRRSTVDDTQTAADGSLLPTTAAVAGVRPAAALVETAQAGLNEAQIREIARQEVRAALRGDTGASNEAAAPAADAPGAATPGPPGAPGAPRIGPIAPGAPRTGPAGAAPPAPASAAPLPAGPADAGGPPLF